MKLIVGLGNPGLQYANTRHNVGFMFIDFYVKEKKIDDEFKSKFKGEYIKTTINNEEVIIFKPFTYMNLSGQAVKEIANFFKIDHKDILIIYDDKDIPFASLRLREKGNPGSHNGMKNITMELNDINFPRIRVGIGSPLSMQDMIFFVLSKFSKEEIEDLQSTFKNLTKCVDLFIDNKFVYAMNQFNKRELV